MKVWVELLVPRLVFLHHLKAGDLVQVNEEVVDLWESRGICVRKEHGKWLWERMPRYIHPSILNRTCQQKPDPSQ